MDGIVLVTGAAGGQQGATGRQVAESLLGRGVPVRAFVRTLDERAERLRRLGADVVVGDLRDIADVEPVMAGVDRVFFTYPVTDGLLDATGAVAAAARAAGVRRLVNVSQLAPQPHSHSPRTRQHWVSEQVLDRAGVGAVHLRATVFYENMRALAALGATGELAIPLGAEDNPIPLVAASDVARVGAVLLAEPDRPAPPYYRLVGETPTVAGIVAQFGAALGVPLRYRDVDELQWREQALAQGWTQHAVEHLSRLWRVFSNAAYRSEPAVLQVTDAVERVTGEPALTLRQFLEANRDTMLGDSRQPVVAR